MLRSPLAPAALPTDLKLSNRRQVLEAFKPGGRYTANAISEQIGLSRQTVMKSIAFFVEKGLVIPVGKGSSTSSGGKRPTLYALAADKYLLGIDLLPVQLRLTLLDFRARVIDALEEQGDFSDNLRSLLDKAGRCSGQLLARNGLAQAQLVGVIVSSPGIINYERNLLKYSALAPGWGKNICLADALQPYFAPGTPIFAENLARTAAASLLHHGRLQNRRVLVLYTARGLSGTLIINDHIHHGKDSLIGEIGHMILSLNDTDPCGCGGAGCFERLVSDERIRHLVKQYGESYGDSPLSAIPQEALTVQDVFAASKQGDALGLALVSGLARIFSVALRNISLVFDPDLVVLQGRYAAAPPFFQSELFRYLRTFRYYSSASPFALCADPRPLAELSRQGAYTLLLDHFFSDSALYE